MKIIYGPKGTGKTKAIIDGANAALAQSYQHHTTLHRSVNQHMYHLARRTEADRLLQIDSCTKDVGCKAGTLEGQHLLVRIVGRVWIIRYGTIACKLTGAERRMLPSIVNSHGFVILGVKLNFLSHYCQW